MAIEAVHDATVAGNDVAEILDLERSLETRSEETAEGTDDAAKIRFLSQNLQCLWPLLIRVVDVIPKPYLAKIDMKKTWIKNGSIQI